ncbi:hypothetical protein KY343_06285 [Candidatus Woesearchaeota archaeon]|nr:hypothetical protein [Candidatus Woesearchaeota archaeon]
MKTDDISRLVHATVRITVEEEGKTVKYQGELYRKTLSPKLPVWYKMDNPIIIYPDGKKEKTGGHKIFRESDLERYVKEGRVEIIEESAGKYLLMRRA